MWLELGVPWSRAMKAGLRASEPSRSEHGTLHDRKGSGVLSIEIT